MKLIKTNLLIILEIWHIDVKEHLIRGYLLVFTDAPITNAFIINKLNTSNTDLLILFIWPIGPLFWNLLNNMF